MSRRTRRWALFIFVALGLILVNYPLIAVWVNDMFAIRNDGVDVVQIDPDNQQQG